MNRTFTFRRNNLLLLAFLLLLNLRAGATFTQVVISSGFNADVIANGVGLPNTSTTNAFDNTAYCMVAPTYQQTAASSFPVYALPATGLINSVQTTGLSFQLANYTGNNSLRVTGLTSPSNNGTLVFTNQTLIGDIYLLGAGGDGSATFSAEIKFTDNTTQTITGLTVSDWFGGSPYAIQGIGRVQRNSPYSLGANATDPRLYQIKLTLLISNYSRLLQSVKITRTGGSSTTSVLNILAVSVDHQTCLPPQGLLAAGTTTTSSNLSWNAVTGAAGYQYAVTTSSNPPGSGTATTGTTYNPTNLNPGTTYYLHVRTDCGGGVFSVWNTQSFSTSPCPSAGAPVITNNVPGSVTYSWPGTATPGVVDYQWKVTTTAASPGSWATTSFTTATDNALTPGAVYYAHVRSNCGTTQASWQNVQFTNPFPPCGTPNPPLVTDSNMHGAKITWNPTLNHIAYQYSVSTSATPPASGTTIPDTFYNATNLTSGTVYYAHVRTHCGTTNYSSWATTMFSTPATCLGAPVINVSNVTAYSAFIDWNMFPGIMYFEYFLDQNPAPPSFSGYAINYNQFAPLSLNSGTTYYFHLRTRCDTTNYSAWQTVSFTTQNVCSTPGTPVVSNITSGSAQFNWNAVTGAQSYEYAVTTSTASPASGTLITLLSHTETGLTPGTQYYFHLRVFCSASDSSGWVMKDFMTQGTNAIDNVIKDGAITVYPNPAGAVLNVELDVPVRGAARLMLFDLSGKIAMTVPVSSGRTQLDLAHLPSGMYFLKYIDQEQTSTIKVQKL